MNQWNQRTMFPGMPTGLPQNVNSQQNYYRPPNPQQFYPNPAATPFHGGFQPRQTLPQNMNPLPRNFSPNIASQPQPTRPMTPAEMESLKKKRNFEEQQKRLMALKQKNIGQSVGSQAANPLNDLFGKKGSSRGMTSLLGSLGDVSKSRNGANVFQGPQGSTSVPVQTLPNYAGSSTGIQAPVASNVASSNWNSPGLPNINPAMLSQSSGNIEQGYQRFNSKTVSDDFGDFQQSSSMQSSAMRPSTVEFVEVPKTDLPNVSNVDKTVQQSVVTGHVKDKEPDATNESRKNALSTPSIEDLLKKSLTLNNQPQSFAKRFEKHKIDKTVKHQPSHFTESTKASKFENMEVLSEMFTIPQSLLAQPSHVTTNISDDWSDFSGAAETVSQEQNPQTGLDPPILGLGPPMPGFGPPTPGFGPPTSGQTIPVSSVQNLSAEKNVPTSGLEPGPVTFNWESGNRGGFSTLQEPRDEMGIFSKPAASTAQMETMWNTHIPSGSDGMLVGVSTVQTGGIWNTTQVPSGSDGMLVGVNTQGNSGQGMVSEGGFGDFQSEVPRNNILSGAAQDQAISEVGQEIPTVDPDLAIYGLALPVWSKNTTMLPAVYKQVHKMCSSTSSNIISTDQLYPILLSSDLPRDKLGHIWSKCNKASPGELNEQELYLILGMVALAQVGLQVNKLTLEKLASCVTAPIPSFPESIFQSEASPVPDVPFSSTDTPNLLSEQSDILPTVPDTTADTIFHPTPHVDAVKHPDWSKWKTSKAAQIDDKFTDFQILKPNDSSISAQKALPSLNLSNDIPSLSPRKADTSMASFQSLSVKPSVAGSSETTNKQPPMMTEGFSIFGERHSNEGQQSLSAVKSNESGVFGEMTGSDKSGQQFGSFESNTMQSSSHMMSAPLHTSQRYTLTGDDENVDEHEQAWLKCLTSCFEVIIKSCQTLQNISDPNLINEIFSSQLGISHFSAIIEIHHVSQRIKASIQKSASNNKKLKESLQNIDNIWKTFTSFEPFRKLLPLEHFNFSGCHIKDDDDVNMSCGVCLLNVNKPSMNSSQKNYCGKLNYGKRQYHTTCANFWCNKVDSVLPSLQFNNSLI